MRNVGVRYVKPYTARHGAGVERIAMRHRDAYQPKHAAPVLTVTTYTGHGLGHTYRPDVRFPGGAS